MEGHREEQKEQRPKEEIGDETTFVVNPGLSEDSVSAFSRSGGVNVKVKIQGTGGDTTPAQDMLAATLKRLQQVQDGERATATAGDEASKN